MGPYSRYGTPFQTLRSLTATIPFPAKENIAQSRYGDNVPGWGRTRSDRDNPARLHPHAVPGPSRKTILPTQSSSDFWEGVKDRGACASLLEDPSNEISNPSAVSGMTNPIITRLKAGRIVWCEAQRSR